MMDDDKRSARSSWFWIIAAVIVVLCSAVWDGIVVLARTLRGKQNDQ